MHTVSAALGSLVWPALAVLLLSSGLWIFSVRPDTLIRRGKRALACSFDREEDQGQGTS